MSVSGAALGLALGAIPSGAMLLASLLFYSFEVPNLVTAACQNFTAGLILAAVAAELFPLMLDTNDERSTWVGVSAGFLLGFIALNSIETIIEVITEAIKKRVSEDAFQVHTQSPLQEKGSAPRDIEMSPSAEKKRREVTMVKTEAGEILDDTHYEMAGGEELELLYEGVDMAHAERAISHPNHKMHIMEHLQEIKELITGMEKKSAQLLVDALLTVEETEQLTEAIDESIHLLQYKIDHSRRLLQGSETNNHTDLTASVPSNLTDEKKIAMNRRLTILRCTVNHLIEHLSEPLIDKETISEMLQHMVAMDKQIDLFHENIDEVASKWRRKRLMPYPELGATLPMSLIVPVTLDCFVDGFLIGVSVSLSSTAGYILAGAHCLEMSFLGMAYSARVVKCTGSSSTNRKLAVGLPPLLIFLASGLGAFLAKEAEQYPAIFVAFVAFGVVCLISLACTELIIDAKEAQGGNEMWYIQALLFLGIYLVLMIEGVMPH